MQVWSFLNIFGYVGSGEILLGLASDAICRWPLALSNFSLDEFVAAFRHQAAEPRCLLLAEMHGTLLTWIAVDGFRVHGTIAPTIAGGLPPLARAKPGSKDDEMSEDEKKRFILRAVDYSRKWDRSKRLSCLNGRIGWERHLIGCLCQVCVPAFI